MCIICAKPQGVKMPSMATLQECWKVNSDGAGIAYVREKDKSVTILKGFMKFKRLKSVLSVLDFQENDSVIIHFRFATHGKVDCGNCHPFPLSNKSDDLRAIKGEYPVAIAHNGIFGNMPQHNTLSDTQKFIATILANPYVMNGLDSPAIKELIRGYCGSTSKLAILKPEKMTTIGDFIEDEGVLYSNSGYKTYGYITKYDNWKSRYDDDYPLIGKSIDKECELCGNLRNVDYDEGYQCYICNNCLDYTVNQDAYKPIHGI